MHLLLELVLVVNCLYAFLHFWYYILYYIINMYILRDITLYII